MIYSKITAVGGYLPLKILTNKDLEKSLDTSDEWIVAMTGIKERHIIGSDETNSDMAYKASLDAIHSSKINPQEIDLIIIATTTPDKIFPSVACSVQNKLGIGECPAFDIQAVCSGFIYALSIADKFINTGSKKNVLVVGVDAMSKITDYTDRSNAILWGDGAGAVIVSASDKPGIISTHIHSDGQYESLLHVPRSENSAQKDTIEMQGNQVFKIAVNTLDRIVDETLKANNLKKVIPKYKEKVMRL